MAARHAVVDYEPRSVRIWFVTEGERMDVRAVTAINLDNESLFLSAKDGQAPIMKDVPGGIRLAGTFWPITSRSPGVFGPCTYLCTMDINVFLSFFHWLKRRDIFDLNGGYSSLWHIWENPDPTTSPDAMRDLQRIVL